MAGSSSLVCFQSFPNCHLHTISSAGVLQYFVDGILPLLRYFYANLYEPPKSAEGEQGKQLRITERLFKNLLVCPLNPPLKISPVSSPTLQALCDVLMLYFTTEPQVRLYRSTVVTLVKFPTAAMRSAEVENVSRISTLVLSSVCVTADAGEL